VRLSAVRLSSGKGRHLIGWTPYKGLFSVAGFLLSILKEKRNRLRNHNAVIVCVPFAAFDLVDQILNFMPLKDITKSFPCISLQLVRARQLCEFVGRGRPQWQFDVMR
jgi:hypothetical protein